MRDAVMRHPMGPNGTLSEDQIKDCEFWASTKLSPRSDWALAMNESLKIALANDPLATQSSAFRAMAGILRARMSYLSSWSGIEYNKLQELANTADMLADMNEKVDLPIK